MPARIPIITEKVSNAGMVYHVLRYPTVKFKANRLLKNGNENSTISMVISKATMKG